MTGGTSVPHASAGPTSRTPDGAAEALEQRVGDRLVHEDPRRGRALLAGVVERALRDRGHRVVEVGVGVDDDAVLAAHLRHDAGELARAVRQARGVAHELQADGARAGERDRRDVAVSGERRARLARAGQQRDRAGGHAALAERLDRARARSRAPARRA